MRQLCSDSSCSYLGRSLLQAIIFGSVLPSNSQGDKREVSRGHSTEQHSGRVLSGGPEHQTRSETFISQRGRRL